MDKASGVGLHNLDGCAQSVGHIHHVHVGASLDGALELLALDSAVVDVDSIVGGAATRRCHIGDKAWEAHRTGVYTKAGEVVIAQQLTAHLGHAIHGARLLDGVLRGAVLGSVWSKGTNRAGGEHGALALASHLEGVHQAANTYLPSQQWLALGNGRQQGCQVVDGVDVIFLHGIGNLLGIGDVYNFLWPTLSKFAFRFCAWDISGYYGIIAINAS